MMEYEIKKGVPIPRRTRAKYPFALMEIGDCVAVWDGDSLLAVLATKKHADRYASRYREELRKEFGNA